MANQSTDDYRNVRGFNYNPSYCATLYEAWDRFDAAVWRTEIQRGKTYFPALNTLRVWLDWNAYLHDPAGFVRNVGMVLDICGDQGIQLHPTLFNRWHDFSYDFGGIYYDQLLDRNFARFKPYIDAVAGTFKDDTRILMWDLCNEPQQRDPRNLLDQLEIDWLRWVAQAVRDTGAQQPITIGTMFGANIELVADVCDVLCFHPYSGWWDDGFAASCDQALALAKRLGKPLIANETCQGSLNNTTRTQIIRGSLGALKERGIGWCAWQLHGGRMISANRQVTDFNCRPGDHSYMAFIEPDGTLRPGHEVYNEY
jgi:endo-1,4-beta-mannosidase